MLLDTHIFLWWLFDDPKLSNDLRMTLSDMEQKIFVSSASVWEITTKFRLGKLPQAIEIANNVPDWILRAGFSPLAINSAHAQLAGSWQHQHRDPFDRMLAAQSKIENLVLATDDRLLKSFDINTVS